MSIERLAVFSWALIFGWATVAGAAEPVELFNGKDFTGWKQRGGAAKYSIEDGAVVGHSVPNTSNTFLTTEKDYGNFELELDFKIDDPKFNSGIQIRSHVRPEGKGERVYGYQVEIDPRSDRAWSAGLYFEGGSDLRPAGWLNDLTKNKAAREAFKLGDWNHVRVVANGRHIQTWLNGVPAADFTDNDKGFIPSGFIALQVHDVGNAQEPKEVRWRKIKLKELGEPTTMRGRPLQQVSPSSGIETDVSGNETASFEGFEFAIPEGWTRVAPDRSNTKAMILLNGTVWNKADGMLKVDVGKPALPTAQETARAIAGRDGVSISLDGQEGISVSTESVDMSKPQHAVVIYRDNKAYLLMAAGTRGTDVTKAFEQVVRTWQWSPKP